MFKITRATKHSLFSRKENLWRYFYGFAAIFDGLVTVLSFGFLYSNAQLAVTRKTMEARIEYMKKKEKSGEQNDREGSDGS